MGKVFDSQDVDELILTDITATQENREPDWVNIQAFADECAMPLTVGGGIANLDHIRRSLQVGGDKVTINTEAVRNPEFISASADALINSGLRTASVLIVTLSPPTWSDRRI